MQVFARRGMVATKICDIPKEARLSHGLVYHYFKSREEIFYDSGKISIKQFNGNNS
ncbi:TetR/AcrR family transcriptional regulator [Metabacillus litoralis]|uniref:TetR/AcrR family transcriptional regulator n=1 Tax=Metabacillus litoralis TaxID=152268 RepID=UPI0013CE96E1